MANIKETLISTMINGKNVLTDIDVSRKNGKDISREKGKVNETIAKLHVETLQLEVSQITNATDGAKTIRLVSRTGYLPSFEAGQYINLVAEIDGVRTTRPYSICSSPKQRAYYEVTVARIATGFVSDYFLDKLAVGDFVEANGPAGTFHYNPVSHYKQSVFLAGGSGITPFMAMISEILDSGLDRDVTLIYGARNVESAIFHKELTEYANNYSNFKYILVLSDKDAKGGDRAGFIDADCIKQYVADLAGSTYYICGPQIMADFCHKALKELDVKNKDIRHEMFGSTADITKEAGYPSELTGNEVFNVTVGDKVIPARADESLLQALERSGVRVNVCCRSGECSLCRVKLAAGKVFMPRGVLLRHADEKFGYIHSCKAYAISDLEIIL